MKRQECIFFVTLLLCCANLLESASFATARDNHQAKQVAPQELKELAILVNATDFRTLLDPLLTPRVVGTHQHEVVKEYLVQQMQVLGWHVEQDVFTDTTPIGPQNFTNVIAKQNPNASRFLVLACHYDSLRGIDNFIGATDSAVPCTMMLHLAKILEGPLKISQNTNVSLQFIFFDGEEAFKTWGPQDSLYGSRHLAQKLSQTPYFIRNHEVTSELDRMDILVMLDLIGTKNTQFHNFYLYQAPKWYFHLMDIEKRLMSSNLLIKNKNQPLYFLPYNDYQRIEDDHIPFINRGVRIIHLISLPFPVTWHTVKDDITALDFNTILDITTILSVFVAEYINLNV